MLPRLAGSCFGDYVRPLTRESRSRSRTGDPGVESISKSRIPSIDQFRGLAIILMVIVNYLGGVRCAPAWLKHAPEVGLTVADLVAPLFIFAIGMTFRLSFERRADAGIYEAVMHVVTRFLAIAGIGAILSTGEDLIEGRMASFDWGALQAIGAAGLICLVFIRLGTLPRLVAGIGLLAAYQALLDRYFLKSVLNSHHGGLPGALGWGAMLIMATALADLFHDPRRRRMFAWSGAAILVAGCAAAFAFPISKNRVSLSYVLVTTGISALLMSLFDRARWEMPVLVWWGANPILLYLLHQFMLGIFFLPGIPWLYAAAKWPTVLLELTALLGALTLISRALYRRKILVKL